MIRRIIIYSLIITGSLIFAWPFVWMIATSAKLDRELFTDRTSILPERPNPRTTSPYIEDHRFAAVTGPRHDEAIAIIQEQLQGYNFPATVGRFLARLVYA